MRRFGCRTSEAHDHAQTPLDTTTIPIQRPEFGSSNGEPSPLARGMDYEKIGDIHKWPEFESSSGEPSPLARGMDYDKTGYIHSGEGWIRQTCRPQQGKRANWRRKAELSTSMNPTQYLATNSRNWKKQQGTGLQTRWSWLGTTQAFLQEYCRTVWASPKGILAKVFVLLERGASISGPVRSVSESLAYDTSGQPLDLRPHRRISS